MVTTRSKTSRDVSPLTAAEKPQKTSRETSQRSSGQPSPQSETDDRKDAGAVEDVKERTVREQLKKTHVEEPNTEDTSPTSAKDGDRGRPRRKRSFEEIAAESAEDAKAKHVRKRSKSSDEKENCDEDYVVVEKPSTPSPTTNPVPAAPAPSQKTVPKTSVENHAKVTQETESFEGKEVTKETEVAKPELTGAASKNSAEEPDSKIAKEPQQSFTKIPESSGFANASAQSPFASISGSNSTRSVFGGAQAAVPPAKLSFSSMASSSASPFAAASSPKPDEKGVRSNGDSAASGFASLAGKPSIFGLSMASGKPFGTTNGSSFGTGSRLSNFSTGKGTLGLSGAAPPFKPIKAFGAPGDDDEVDDEDEDESSAVDHVANPEVAEEDDKTQDTRFYEQEIETGEEDEHTHFQDRAKLYISEKKQWKERCTGVFKINIKHSEANGDSSNDSGDEQSKKVKLRARFIMRSDASRKVLLNSPLTRDIQLEDPAKGPPTGRQAVFMAFVDGETRMMLVKMRTEAQIETLVQKVQELHEDL